MSTNRNLILMTAEVAFKSCEKGNNWEATRAKIYELLGPESPRPENTHDAEVHDAAYLGDGLYASFDGFQLKLFASNGIVITNEVYLEPSVFRKFIDYAKEKGFKT